MGQVFTAISTPSRTFFVFSGRFEIAWGDQGEHTLVLEPLDMISVPRGENRSFRNVSNEIGRLLVMIVPETDEQVDPISYAPSLAKEIESNLEKWLPDAPDRQQWKMEDPIDGKTDVPMAELPKELEDMVGRSRL